MGLMRTLQNVNGDNPLVPTAHPAMPAMPQKKFISKVARIAGPVLSAVGFPVAGAIVSGVGGMIGGKEKTPQAAQYDAAQQRTETLMKQQEAAVARERQAADTREAELDAQLAAQRRAASARRRGNSGLSFTGPTTSLKSTLGG